MCGCIEPTFLKFHVNRKKDAERWLQNKKYKAARVCDEIKAACNRIYIIRLCNSFLRHTVLTIFFHPFFSICISHSLVCHFAFLSFSTCFYASNKKRTNFWIAVGQPHSSRCCFFVWLHHVFGVPYSLHQMLYRLQTSRFSAVADHFIRFLLYCIRLYSSCQLSNHGIF